jgi:hypothetical protein
MKEEESSEEARAGENQFRATGAPRLVEYVLRSSSRDAGNYCPVGRRQAANGTGCFALVETDDKSRK